MKCYLIDEKEARRYILGFEEQDEYVTVLYADKHYESFRNRKNLKNHLINKMEEQVNMFKKNKTDESFKKAKKVANLYAPIVNYQPYGLLIPYELDHLKCNYFLKNKNNFVLANKNKKVLKSKLPEKLLPLIEEDININTISNISFLNLRKINKIINKCVLEHSIVPEKKLDDTIDLTKVRKLVLEKYSK